jgi:hypothetical protein
MFETACWVIIEPPLQRSGLSVVRLTRTVTLKQRQDAFVYVPSIRAESCRTARLSRLSREPATLPIGKRVFEKMC